MANVHVRTWRSGSATITDLTNAGKRGKTCDQFHIDGASAHYASGTPSDCITTDRIIEYLDQVDVNEADATYANVVAAVLRIMHDRAAETGIECGVKTSTRSIRGVDAPLPVLAHRTEKWAIAMDHDGIIVSDLTDQANEPRLIVHPDQKDSQAYKLAAKVWEKVKTCDTFSQVWDVLNNAGCRMHFYCAMD